MRPRICSAWSVVMVVATLAALAGGAAADPAGSADATNAAGSTATAPRAAASQPTAAAADGLRVIVAGHSFHVFIAKPLADVARAAGVRGHANAGVQSIGGSRVSQHWDLPDEKNKAKQALAAGGVDVLTLSPAWVMPDAGIDRFADLAVRHNPDARVVVQQSWAGWDGLEPPFRVRTNAELVSVRYMSTRRRLRTNSGRKSSMPWIWSACSWVISTPSIQSTLASRSCSRRSGEVSTSTRVMPFGPRRSTKSEVRRRRFFGLLGSQAPQPSAGRGTPMDDPQPRMVKRNVMPPPRMAAAPC